VTTTPRLWKSATQANTTTAGNQFDSQITALPDSGYLVAWDDTSGAFNPGGDAIVGQRYDPAGNKVGGEIDLTQSLTGSDSEPAITHLSNGNVAVALVHAFGGDENIEVRVFNSSLGLIRTDFIDFTASQTFNPSITALADGGYLVSYTIGSFADTDVVGRIVSSLGVVSVPFNIDVFPDRYGSSEVATLSNGNVVAVYQDTDVSQIDIKFGIFTPAGTQVTGPSFVFGGAGAGLESDPHVAALRDGGFIVVWTDPDGPDPTDIRATLYSNDGTVNVGFRNVLVNTTTSGFQDTADVVGLSDGGFLVSWLDHVGFFIHAQRFDAVGHQIGSEFIVSDDHDFAQSLGVEATTLSDGRIAFAVDGIPSGVNKDVKSSIFDPRTLQNFDFNGDSFSDLPWQNDNGQPAIWTMNGPHITGSVALPNPGPTWHIAEAADFNGDSKSDILWQNDNGLPSIWTMNGTNVTNAAVLPNPGPTWHIAAAGDFNGDGDADILWRHDSGLPSIWTMNGTSVTNAAVLSNPGPTWHIAAAGDFNGDGKADILWQNDSGLPSIWTMDGTNVTNAAVLSNPGSTWHIAEAGDFNGDGKADILWQNDSGQPAIWTMNGTNITGSVALPNPGPTWHIAKAADFNSDGKADIVWRHDSGLPAIWTMDGTNVTNAAVLPNPGSDWHLV
jgi:FG-GAP-like repeat